MTLIKWPRVGSREVQVLLAVTALAGVGALIASSFSGKGLVGVADQRLPAPPPDVTPAMPIDELLATLANIPRVANSSIPQLIHQSYKTLQLPADFAQFARSWRRNHPASSERRFHSIGLLSTAQFSGCCGPKAYCSLLPWVRAAAAGRC